MPALNNLRAKFSKDAADRRAAIDRDNGLKTFEWMGDSVPCATCAQTGRNLNSAMMCTHCATGKPIEPPKSMTASEYKNKLAGKLDLAKWPFTVAPRPPEAMETETFLPKRFDQAGGLPAGTKVINKLDEADLLRFQDGTSNKFYSMARYGWLVELRWGRASAEGQRDTKVFNHDAEAQRWYRKQLESKKAKGYTEVFSAP